MTIQTINNIKTLISLANELDSRGLISEANVLDDFAHDIIEESVADDEEYDLLDDLSEFISPEDAKTIRDKALSMITE
jgi:hypothetical protein